MDEATRKMIAEEFTIWVDFFNACLIIWFWVDFTTGAPRTQFPRFARFVSWLSGIWALAIFVILGLMNTMPFDGDCPNPLHPWMRVILVFGYLAAVGYIIKRRSEIQPPKLPPSQ